MNDRGMTHRLNTNKQFMVGNGILAFAVIAVVVIFSYMSMRLMKKEGERRFLEQYTVVLQRGFEGDSLSVLVNDSLLSRLTVRQEPCTLTVQRFQEESALMVVDHATDYVSVFQLAERGGTYTLVRDSEGIKLAGSR